MNYTFPRGTFTSGKHSISFKASIPEILIIDSRFKIISLLHPSLGISDIYLAQDLITNNQVILKILKDSYSSFINNKSDQIIHEGTLIANMCHPNIIQVLSKTFSGKQKSNIKKKQKEITYIPLQYTKNGDLLSLVKKCSFLSENVTLYLFKQILSAVDYLHMNGICHRDIKLDNILIDEHFKIKLADFEYAERICESENWEQVKMKIKLGTEQYMAPELHYLNNEEMFYYGNKVDIFACGIVLLAMITGKLYFETASPSDYFYRMYSQDAEKFFTLVSDSCSENIIRVIRKMIAIDPKDRPSAREILEDEIFKGVDVQKAVSELGEILNKEREN